MSAIDADARFLMLGVLAEIELFAGVPDDALESDNPYIVAMCWTGVPFLPAEWAGKPLTVSRRMSFSRAAMLLARRGLVVRITELRRDRVRCLVPTKFGIQVALDDAGDRVDRVAVCKGLGRTIWGRPLIAVVKHDSPRRNSNED